MERTTISLDSELHSRLKAIAAQRGVSVATVIREMLAEGCAQRPRRFLSLGMGASGDPSITDQLSERVPPRTWRSC
jgi:plasmid stability protein